MVFGIIFDLDGTLLDTLEDLTDSVNYALSQFGCPNRSAQEVRSYLGNGAANLIRCAMPGKADDPDFEQVLKVYQAYYKAHSQDKTGPYPGILAALEELGKTYPLAIVSNKTDATVRPMCKQYFGDICARGETADCPRKPAPDMVWQTMQKLGVDRCIYVGDSEVDVQTAKNANVPCVSVTWGFRTQAQLQEAGAEYFCHEAAQLPQIIEEIIHGK